MLLSIETRGPHSDELSYLLHKRPDRFQSFDASFGKVHVFYPRCDDNAVEACVMLDVDPVAMARKHRDDNSPLAAYVNDRPFVASSFLSTALSANLGTAMAGRCHDRPAAVDRVRPLAVRLQCVPVRGGEAFLRGVFEPLGYEVEAITHALDPTFPAWGESAYLTVTLRTDATVRDVLRHLYVLVPVFDNAKHYFIGEAEIEKLVEKAGDWLASHPMKAAISRRYLRHQSGMVRRALGRLENDADESSEDSPRDVEPSTETPRLHDQRHAVAVDRLKRLGVRRVVDLGCGDGKLLRRLVKEPSFSEIVGMDVSVRSLEIAARRLRLERFEVTEFRFGESDAGTRVRLMQGSVLYRDRRVAGFDAACLVEVIEHLEPRRVDAMAAVVLGHARPRHVVITTPNAEYNAVYGLAPGQRRHRDHRFEWTRVEMTDWCERTAERYGYDVAIEGVGDADATLGCPTMMAVFSIRSTGEKSEGSDVGGGSDA